MLVQLCNKDKTFTVGVKDGIMYTEIKNINTRIYKNININNNIYYIELSFYKKELCMYLEGKKYTYTLFPVHEIIIGRNFMGILTKMLYFESTKYKKSRIMHLEGSDIFIKVIKNLEMWCVSKGISGIFLKSKKVYWWHKNRVL